MTVTALIPAAGKGVRLGADKPKAFVDVGGQPMLTRAVSGVLASGVVDRVVVMVPVDLIDATAELVPASVRVIAGGAERVDSVRAGLQTLTDGAPDDIVLVHDAARCLTPAAVFGRVVAAAADRYWAGAIPGVPVADTIKTVNAAGGVTGTPQRSGLRAIQTPQGFRLDVLRKAYAHDGLDGVATDDAGLVEALGGAVRVVEGDPLAFKITTEWDLRAAERVLTEA